MTIREFLSLVTNALEVEPGTLTLETEIASVPEWDSIGWLTIVSDLDDKLDVHFPSKEIRECTTVQDLVNYVSARVTLV